jgi:hypothetical protein
MTKTINQNFVIRWNRNGEKETHLCGAGKYAELLGNPKLAEKHFNKALNSPAHVIVFKLRRGLTIKFCSK